jgi:hypothetical protein
MPTLTSKKEVKRTSGDFHVQTEQDIHLETQYNGTNNGTVYVWGNLFVQGSRTEVNTQDLSIGDKVLILNKGDPGTSGGTVAGVSGDGISGISITRGGPAAPNENANIVFNQNKNWTYNGVTTRGMWDLLIGPPTGGVGTASGITVSAIRTGTATTDLSLLGAENASATVTMKGVINYTNRLISRNEPDDVPNKGYVDYAVARQADRRRIQLNFQDSLDRPVVIADTYVELLNQDVPGYPAGTVTETQLRLSIGGQQWITMYQDRLILGEIKVLKGNEITMELPNQKLVLSTRPSGGTLYNPSIEAKTSISMLIDRTYNNPFSESERVKIYPKDQGAGNTGLYYVNKEGTRDEFISKRKSFFASLVL